MASNDYDAGYADGRKDAQEKISKLEDEINHLEDNFTEWLKEYRAMTERVAALNAELACSIVSGNDAREQSLGYVYDLNSAAKRIAELEAENEELKKAISKPWMGSARAAMEKK
jgi:chromosome segregation ATPase